MLLTQTFLSAVGALSTQSVLLLALAALACILGAEIVGICILISKLSAARKQKRGGDDENRLYTVAPIFLAGALGTPGTVILGVLAVLTVLAAIALVALLFTVRALGYDVVSAKPPRAKAKPAEAPAEAFAEDLSEDSSVMPEASEEQRQDAYTTSEEDPFAFAAEEYYEEPAASDAEEPVEEPLVEEEIPDEEQVSEDETLVASEEPATEESDSEEIAEELPEEIVEVPAEPAEEAVACEGEQPADPAQPYKVVEKIVTETVKEVYKEAPQPEAQPTAGLSESVVEKLVDLLDYEIRSRREAERAEEDKNGKDGSIATFVAADLSDDEDDEDDDIEEAEDAKGDDDEERDDEENEIDDDRFTGNERIIGFDEATDCYIVAHYRKSFEAKLIQARPNIKQYYSELKNALLSYKGTKNRISWTADSFHNGRTPIAKINVKTRILELYLAIDPASLEGTVYRGQDVSNKKKYADTPFRYKLRTPRKFKWAMELVQRVCEEKGLSPIDIERVDYEAQYPFDTTENLVERKLIKEYIRQEKPATTFELDPDHVPAVPNEDDSVIPANANFSWEFDNERMEEKEPDPVPTFEATPEPTPEVEAAPVEETTPAEPSPILRETVKVTEVRYTERYYNGSDPVYEQVVTTTEPIEAVSESAEAEIADEMLAEEACPASAAVAVTTATDKDTEEPLDPEEEPLVENALESEEETEEETEEERFFAEIEHQKHEVIYADDSSYASDEDELLEEESVTEEFYEEESTEEQFYEEQPAEEQYYEEQPAEEQYYEEQPAEEQYYEEQPAEEQYYEEQPAEEQYYEEQPAEEQFYEEQPAEEQFYEEQPAEEQYYFEQESDEQLYVAAEESENGYFEEAAEEYAEPVTEEPIEDAPVYDAAPAPKFNPTVAVIDICSVEAAFAAGETVSLDTLKEKGLVLTGVVTLKIYASSTLSKPLTVEANHLTLEAIQTISAAGGEIIIVR